MIDDSDEDESAEDDSDTIIMTGTDNNKTTKFKINKKKLLNDE